jgi:hypothetical protein
MAFGVRLKLPGIRPGSQGLSDEYSHPSARTILDLRIVASLQYSEACEAKVVPMHVTRSRLSLFADLVLEL